MTRAPQRAEYSSCSLRPQRKCFTWQLKDNVLVLVLPESVYVAQLVRDDKALGGGLRPLAGKEVHLPAFPVIAEGGYLDGLGVHDHHGSRLDPIAVAQSEPVRKCARIVLATR